LSISPTTDFQPIISIDAVDLSRHALVEASAGTGKTYTIEKLVVRLLQEEPDLYLENILLVTFTEKATSELKLRIRQNIEQVLDHPGLDDAVRRKLSDTLDNFDSAAITTIHGFCHTLLKEFPFETGNLFKQELIDDGPLLEKLLRQLMRSQWPRKYGDRLELLLELSGFKADAEPFIRRVIDLVQQLSNDPDHETLIPDPAQMDLDALWHTAQETVWALKQLTGEPPGLVDGYSRLNINARTRSAVIRDVVEPLQQALAQVDSNKCQLSAFLPVIAFLGARHASGGRNIDRLVPQKWLKAGNNLHVCPNLEAIRDRLDQLLDLFTRLSHLLTLETVNGLQVAAKAMKLGQGWISYQDMLTRVAEAVSAEDADAGLRTIGRRYRVVFVDEFQDTDVLQWRIFSTLFLKGDQHPVPNRLFLIGDPKQAIYAFRGADVFTYLDARRQMKQLADRGQANLYALNINWRSSPQLVSAFNRIFIQDTWFGSGDRQDPYTIGYTPSDSPPHGERSEGLSGPASGPSPLHVIDLTGASSHAVAKTQLAEFICREIRRLILATATMITGADGRQRLLEFGDIAVLVRSQSEFALIEPLLADSAIPYAYYRKPGLFQSREARWLAMMLRAVCHPQQAAVVKQAWLTPFFDMDPQSLAPHPEPPPDHNAQLLLVRWHHLGLRRRWGPLFQSLMEASGMTLRHCTDPGWQRTQTNLQQLFDYLESAAYLQNLDMGGVVALLDGLRRSTVAGGSDADIHQIEDEGQKVQILTMHVSKGLEFPVVFVAGGLTVRADDSLTIYHAVDPDRPEQGCRKIIDLTAASGRQQVAKEREDENKRLYYVALTRARHKLYVPYYPETRNYSWIGPICRFVSASIQRAFAAGDDAPPACTWHPALQAPQQRLGLASTDRQGQTAVVQLPAGDLLPSQADYRHRKLSLESFSSIGHRIGPTTAPADVPVSFNLMEATGRDMDEPAEPTVWGPVVDDPADELPGGTRMGSMFHHIFENVDFQAVMDGPADILTLDPVDQLVVAAMDLFRIDRRWKAQVARMVAATLRMPIELDGERLTLGQLVPEQRRHEMEFYYPLAGLNPEGRQINGCSLTSDGCGNMVIRGFIDLVFLWRDRYYIADWKSNRLDAGYHQAAMAHEIAAAGYELQYMLYTIATLRWLKQRLGRRFDPHLHFGGALYLFIRGSFAGAPGSVFHVGPEKLLPLESIEAAIRKKLARTAW
jgi:exodeoxyribonuclease V beta subunit